MGGFTMRRINLCRVNYTVGRTNYARLKGTIAAIIHCNFVDPGGILIHRIFLQSEKARFFPLQDVSFCAQQPHHGYWLPNILTREPFLIASG